MSIMSQVLFSETLIYDPEVKGDKTFSHKSLNERMKARLANEKAKRPVKVIEQKITDDGKRTLISRLMVKPVTKKEDDINTSIGMLRYLVVKNSHGVWFLRIDDKYQPLPRWMWGHCEKAVSDPVVLG